MPPICQEAAQPISGTEGFENRIGVMGTICPGAPKFHAAMFNLVFEKEKRRHRTKTSYHIERWWMMTSEMEDCRFSSWRLFFPLCVCVCV